MWCPWKTFVRGKQCAGISEGVPQDSTPGPFRFSLQHVELLPISATSVLRLLISTVRKQSIPIILWELKKAQETTEFKVLTLAIEALIVIGVGLMLGVNM